MYFEFVQSCWDIAFDEPLECSEGTFEFFLFFDSLNGGSIAGVIEG